MPKQPLEMHGLDSIESPEWIKEVQKQYCPQYIFDCRAYARGGMEDIGGENKENFGKRIIATYYPWVWQYWNDWFELMLWAWCNNEEIGVTGCMNASKSYSFSFLTWLEWHAAPMRSAAVISSTTKTAIRTRIWYHIKKFRANLFLNGNRVCHPSHIIDSMTLLQGVKGDDMHSMSSVAVEGGKLELAIGNLQGRHPERMIVMVDEGEQTPDAIFSARFNLRGGTTLFKFVTTANAVNPASAYGQFIEPKAGWPSVKHTDQYWETKTGICLHFRGQDSPNVKAGKVIVPGLIQQKDIDAIVQAKGDDSLEYWMYVEGFPAMSGVRNTVLTWAHILVNKANLAAIWQGETKWKGALDPAFTSGGDDCVLRFARYGLRDDGRMTLGLEKSIKIKLTESSGIPIDYQIADKVKEECTARNMDAGDFGMDSTAATSLASIIEQRWKPGIKRLNFGSSATDRKMPGEDKTGKQRCKNRVAEMAFAFAALVRAGQIRGLDSEASQQGCTRQYALEGEKYVLESKAKYKERTGQGSPDVWDCSIILGDLFRDEVGIDQPGLRATADDWEKVAARYRLEDCYEA